MSYCTITNKLFIHAFEVPRLDWTMRSVINCLTTLNISRCATSSQMTSRKLIHTIAMQFSKPCDEEVDLDHLLQSPNRHSRFAANNCSWSYWIIIIAAAIEIQVLRDETHVFAIVNNNNNKTTANMWSGVWWRRHFAFSISVTISFYTNSMRIARIENILQYKYRKIYSKLDIHHGTYYYFHKDKTIMIQMHF